MATQATSEQGNCQKSIIQCDFCSETRKTSATLKGMARLPPGWKRHNEQNSCAKCWSERYVLRTITFPVIGPVDSNWSELREVLAKAWKQSTELANWALNELSKRDIVRSVNMQKLPSMARIYLYPEARARIVDMPSQAVTAVLRSVEQRYIKQRFEVVWLSRATFSPYRFPYPYPVHNQGWKAHIGKNDEILIDVPLVGGKYTLMLRRGKHFHQQMSDFQLIVTGKAVQGEVQLYRQRASSGDHRSGIEDRTPGGGARINYRVMARLTAWLPKAYKAKKRNGFVTVHTAQDAFLVVENEKGDILWQLNGDHVKRWIAEHKRRLTRLKNDIGLQANQVAIKHQCAASKTAFMDKHQRRITTWCHEASAALAKFVDKINVAEVRYDDSNRYFSVVFPWSQVSTLLAMKLENCGIKLVVIGSEIKKAVA